MRAVTDGVEGPATSVRAATGAKSTLIGSQPASTYCGCRDSVIVALWRRWRDVSRAFIVPRVETIRKPPGPDLQNILYDLSQDYRKFIVRSTDDNDLQRA